MRKIRRLVQSALCLGSLLATAAAQEQMPWQPNLETAQRIAAQTNRLVLIHFWAPWCQPCMKLEREVFSKAEVGRALEPNFVLVKLNWDDSGEIARKYGVSSIPTDVIISPEGRLVSHLQSPPSANQYVAHMNQAAAGHRSLAANSQAAHAQQPPAAAQAAMHAPPAYAPQAAVPASATAPAGTPPNGPTSQSAYSNDRYAEYFRQQAPGNPAGGTPNGPAAYANTQMPAGPPAAAPPYGAGPYGQMPPGAAPGAAGPHAAAAGHTTNYGTPYQTQPQPVTQLPAGCPPVGLDGHCPVTLVERKHWAPGNAAWGVIHRGRTYLFLGPAEKDRFLAAPDRYSPVLSGLDPVLALDNQVAVPGRREFGVFGPDNRIYLFADEASLKRFEQNEKRYAAEAVQAMR